MNKILAVLIISLLALGSARELTAQELAEPAMEYHPKMSQRFGLYLGAFWPSKSFSLRVDGSIPNEEIEFDEALRVDDDEVTFEGNLRWRFGQKWSLWAQYWGISDRGGYILDEDIEWEDLVFKEGTFADVGVDMSISRLFFGRVLVNRPNQEFGVGAGLHWLELSAFMQGSVKMDSNSSEIERGTVRTEFPLPNIGTWYHLALSRNWLIGGRLDWLSASVGDYSGELWNAQVGVDWAPFPHVGLGFHYSLFHLDGRITKSDWRGGADSTQHGPLLSLSIGW